MAQKRMLVVDDEENIGRSLRLILEREGYAVSTCIERRRGESAIRSVPTLTWWTSACPTAAASIWCAG